MRSTLSRLLLLTLFSIAKPSPPSPYTSSEVLHLLRLWNSLHIQTTKYESVLDVTSDDGTDGAPTDKCYTNYWEIASDSTKDNIRKEFKELLQKYIPAAEMTREQVDTKTTDANTQLFDHTRKHLANMVGDHDDLFSDLYQEIQKSRNQVIARIPPKSQ